MWRKKTPSRAERPRALYRKSAKISISIIIRTELFGGMLRFITTGLPLILSFA